VLGSVLVLRVLRIFGSVLILGSFVGLAVLALGPAENSRGNSVLVATPAPPPATAATTPAAEPAAEPAASALHVLLEEQFADNRMGWPDNARSTAWLEAGDYRLAPREPSRFVAIGAPVGMQLADVVVTARFRKIGGPPGGGYGLIVRDQAPAARDGVRQDGHYYVLEVGDRGEIGIWRRDSDQWVELLPWTQSGAVHAGEATNEVEVWARGSRLTLMVNGVQVASQLDAALVGGGVGVFVGGDGNYVALEKFVVRTPPEATSVSGTAPQSAPAIVPAPTPPPLLPITRVRLPSIALDSEVVPAELVEHGGSVTWEVPAFKIGHARATASAGAMGNAVLVGHVNSQGSGNVFQNLANVSQADRVELSSGDSQFIYQVVDIRRVGRNDVAVVQPSETASVTLITCIGLWLPHVSDYAERLVVRAEIHAGGH